MRTRNQPARGRQFKYIPECSSANKILGTFVTRWFPGYQRVFFLSRPAGHWSALGADPRTTGRQKSQNQRVENRGSTGRTRPVPTPVAVLAVEHSQAELLGDTDADGRIVLELVAGFVVFVEQHDIVSLERPQDFVEAHARARLLLVRVRDAVSRVLAVDDQESEIKRDGRPVAVGAHFDNIVLVRVAVRL